VAGPFHIVRPGLDLLTGQGAGVAVQAPQQNEARLGVSGPDKPCSLCILHDPLLPQQARRKNECHWPGDWRGRRPFFKLDSNSAE